MNEPKRKKLNQGTGYAFASKAPKREPKLTDAIQWIHWRRNQPDLPDLKEASDERFKRARQNHNVEGMHR